MGEYTICREETRMVYINVSAKNKTEALRLADGVQERKVTPWTPKYRWRIINITS